jgi:hypothetical protein
VPVIFPSHHLFALDLNSHDNPFVIATYALKMTPRILVQMLSEDPSNLLLSSIYSDIRNSVLY